MSKNAQTTTQLHTSHTLAEWCSKFSKPAFNSIWTVKFQLFKLDLEKAEEPEMKVSKSVVSSKKHESSRKTSISALLTMPKPLTVWITTNWKILQEMGIPDHLTWLLRNLYAGQDVTVRTGHGGTDWIQIGKGVHQGCILSPCLFNFMQSTSWEMLGWMKHKLESRLLGEISKPQICRWHHPYGRKWRRTKQPPDESERGECKSWLKTQHWKSKIMASGPITSWQ